METIFRSRVYLPVYTADWNMRNFMFPASCLHHYVFFLWGQKLLKTFHFQLNYYCTIQYNSLTRHYIDC